MANVSNKLAPLEASNAKPKDKSYDLSDGNGLALRVPVSGRKAWIFSYRHPISRKRINLKLASFPATSLKQARLMRNELLAKLDRGIDPQDEKKQAALSEALQFEPVAREWLEINKKKFSPDYLDDIQRSLERYIFPKLGAVKLDALTPRVVIDVIQPVAKKGSLETVKRLCQRINKIMQHAVNTGLIQINTLTGIKAGFAEPVKKNLPTLTPAELPELMKSISRAQIKFTTRCLIEWQLHTMARPSEAAGARWEEIDFDNQVWVLPPERMKKNRQHVVPLSGQAIALLEEMKDISGEGEYIFPADRNPLTHTNTQTANMAIKRMGFKNRLVAHGLRALASTILNEQSFDPDVIETALAHIDKNETRRAYNRADYLERRRTMMQWWSDHIDECAAGSVIRGKKSLKVVAK